MTTNALRRKAIALARRPYTVKLYPDQANDGSVLYVAEVRELPGCLAQGETRREAIRELDSVLIDYIQSILEDGLDVPPPARSLDKNKHAEVLTQRAPYKSVRVRPQMKNIKTIRVASGAH